MVTIIQVARLSVPLVWWRKPYGGLDGNGTSPKGRCEGSPESNEVSSLGKLSVFLNHQVDHSDIVQLGLAWILKIQKFTFSV